MADSGIIPDIRHIATHNSLLRRKRFESGVKQTPISTVETSGVCVHRNGRGGISPAAVRQIHARISGRDEISSSSDAS